MPPVHNLARDGFELNYPACMTDNLCRTPQGLRPLGLYLFREWKPLNM